jgi:hypothetical protein
VAQVVLPEQAVVLPAAQARRREGALHQHKQGRGETVLQQVDRTAGRHGGWGRRR